MTTEVRVAVTDRRAAHNPFLQAKTEDKSPRLWHKCALLITKKEQKDLDKIMRQQIQKAYTNNHARSGD